MKKIEIIYNSTSQKSFFFLFFGKGPHLVMLSVITDFALRHHSWNDLGDSVRCQPLNLDWLHVRQAPYSLYYLYYLLTLPRPGFLFLFKEIRNKSKESTVSSTTPYGSWACQEWLWAQSQKKGLSTARCDHKTKQKILGTCYTYMLKTFQLNWMFYDGQINK